MEKTIAIVGAGLAGLSAGCYGQMNGYQTQIFELHDKPGGLCTSWQRKGYTFDGCIHWLVGSRPHSNFNKVWNELGALQGKTIHDFEEFVRIEDESGRTLIVYTDIDRLEKHMKELAPADAKAIESFAELVRKCQRFSGVLDPTADSSNLLSRASSGLKLLPYLGMLRKYGRLSVQSYATQFTDPFLRWAFERILYMPDFPMLALTMTLAWMHDRDAGYPLGGSLPFSQAIERRYLELGGTIHYRSRVEKILVEDGKAVGIRLADGSEHRADVIISAADGRSTIFDMLDGRYVDDKTRAHYRDLPIFSGVVQVSLGVNRDLSDTPRAISIPLDKPMMVAGEAHHRMGIHHYCYDPSLAPAGKSVVTVLFNSDHGDWVELADERERYDAEKQQIAISVIDQLEKRLPGLAGQVEAVDVATPLTTERYTANWQGSIEGWMLTTHNPDMMIHGMEKTLPGLDNFYMAGQWVEPGGGLPTVAMSGRNVMRTICKRDGKAFVAAES